MDLQASQSLRELALEGHRKVTSRFIFFRQRRRLSGAQEKIREIEEFLRAHPDPPTENLLLLTKALAAVPSRKGWKNLVYADGFDAMAAAAAGAVAPLASLALQVSRHFSSLALKSNPPVRELEEVALEKISEQKRASASPEGRWAGLLQDLHGVLSGSREAATSHALSILSFPPPWTTSSYLETVASLYRTIQSGEQRGKMVNLLLPPLRSLVARENPKGASDLLLLLDHALQLTRSDEEKGNLVSEGITAMSSLLKTRRSGGKARSDAAFTFHILPYMGKRLLGALKPESQGPVGEFLLDELEKAAGKSSEPVVRCFLERLHLVRSLKGAFSPDLAIEGTVMKEGILWASPGQAAKGSSDPLSSSSLARLGKRIVRALPLAAQKIQVGTQLLGLYTSAVVKEGRTDSLPLLDLMTAGVKGSLKADTRAVLLQKGFPVLQRPSAVKNLASLASRITRQIQDRPDRISLTEKFLQQMLPVSKADPDPALPERVRAMQLLFDMPCSSREVRLAIGSLALKLLEYPPPTAPKKMAEEVMKFMNQEGAGSQDQLFMSRILTGYMMKGQKAPFSPERFLPKVLHEVSLMYGDSPSTIVPSLIRSGLSFLSGRPPSSGNPIAALGLHLFKDCQYYYESNQVATITSRNLQEWAIQSQDPSLQEMAEFLLALAADPSFPEAQYKGGTLKIFLKWLAGIPGQVGTVEQAIQAALPDMGESQTREVLATYLNYARARAGAQKDQDQLDRLSLLDSLARLPLPEQSERWKLVAKGVASLASSPLKGEKVAFLAERIQRSSEYRVNRATVWKMALPLLKERGTRNKDLPLLTALKFAEEATLTVDGGDRESQRALADSALNALAQWDGDSLSSIASIASQAVEKGTSQSLNEAIGLLALRSLREEAGNQSDTIILPPVIDRIEKSLGAAQDQTQKVKILLEGLKDLTQISQNTFAKMLQRQAKQSQRDPKTVEQGKNEVKVGDTTVPVNGRNQARAS